LRKVLLNPQPLLGVILFLGLLSASFPSLVSAKSPGQAPTPQETTTPTQGWTQPVNLSRSGAARQPRVLAASDGRLQVFWLDRFDG